MARTGGWLVGPWWVDGLTPFRCQEPVCVISKYTSGLASINVTWLNIFQKWTFNLSTLVYGLSTLVSEVVLMSRYSAGTIKAALDRVAAVVFASVVGLTCRMGDAIQHVAAPDFQNGRPPVTTSLLYRV